MPSTFEIEQTERLLNVESPLGDDALILTRFSGTETLSGLFNFRLDLVSPDHDIQPAEILGKGISWSVRQPGGDRRPFHGIVGSLGGGGSYGRGYRWYSVEVRPAFWLLTHTRNCRIFQQKTVLDIIQQVTADFPDIVLDLSGVTGDHPPRDYCVQYNESDFIFLSRLMEDEGLFYYFRHAAGSHKMVVADNNSTFFDCIGQEVSFGTNPDVEAFLTQWQPKRQFRAGRWAHRDYNFETPTNSLQSSINTVLDVPNFQQFERFDYPGGYMNPAAGDKKTRVRMEAEESGYQSVDAESPCMLFATGGRFTLGTHEISPEESKGYFVTSVTHESSDYSHVTGEGTSDAPDYNNSFTCMSEDINYRDEPQTPRPVIAGLQIATVVGPAGEEIYTDQYGRIKVQFPWDRVGQNNENSSCWMRVVQMFAGAQWGGQFVPRIGMEVLISFLEGDPDRPLVVGCVYNTRNMPPYTLPDNKTQSGLKTHSTLQGGADNYNELRFEDKKGQEQVVLQAEKDMNGLIKNNETRNVGHDQNLKIGNDRNITVEAGNETINIMKGNRSTTIEKGNDALFLGEGNLTIVANKGAILIGAHQDIIITGKTVQITATDGIALAVGDSQITILPGGIKIVGDKVQVN